MDRLPHRLDVIEGVKTAIIWLCGVIEASLLAFILILAFLYLATGYKPALGQQNPNCTEFGFQIATNCCCTQDCCREAEPREFVHLQGDLYRSTVTWQDIQRTGWSPDGRTVKCACDPGGNGRWFKHPRAKVHCLFVPQPAM